MGTYIALLRGINVGGQKKIKMSDLRDALSKGPLKNVRTYIQSGNIVFESQQEDKVELEQVIHDIIFEKFGFEVPILVITSDAVEQIIHRNPFARMEEDNRLYFVLLKKKPDEDLVSAFNQLQFVHEDFHISDNCVYLSCEKGYGNAKLNNNIVENKLKVEATTRNLRTLQKLVQMAGEN